MGSCQTDGGGTEAIVAIGLCDGHASDMITGRFTTMVVLFGVKDVKSNVFAPGHLALLQDHIRNFSG